MVVLLGLFYSLTSYAGFYAATGLGIRSVSANLSNFYVAGVKVQNVDLAVTRPALDITLGYQHAFRSGFFYALEGFYEYVDMGTSIGTQVQAFSTTIDETLSATLNYNFGIGSLLGYRTRNNDTFYTRIGLLFDKLHFRAESTVSGQSDSSYKYQHYDGAAQVGLGFLRPLSKHFSLRGEYTFSFYGTKTATIDINIPVIGEATVLKVTPYLLSNAGTLSLVYSF